MEISILALDLPVLGWIWDSFWVSDPLLVSRVFVSLVSFPWEYCPGLVLALALVNKRKASTSMRIPELGMGETYQ